MLIRFDESSLYEESFVSRRKTYFDYLYTISIWKISLMTPKISHRLINISFFFVKRKLWRQKVRHYYILLLHSQVMAAAFVFYICANMLH